MANTIQIKRGSGAPGTSDIAAYELAYDYTNNKLYIHDGDSSTIVEVGGGSGSLTLGGHTVNDVDIGSEFVDADDHLMTSGAIKEKIESYGYTTASGTVDTSGSPVDNDYAKFTDANTVEGRSIAEMKLDLNLGDLAYLDSVPDSFLKNDANDTTSGTITAAGFTTSGSVTTDTLVGNSNNTNTLLFNDDQTVATNMTTLQCINHINIMTDGNNNGTGDFRVYNGSYDADTADLAFQVNSAGKVNVYDDLRVPSTISHSGDTDTYISFTNNRIRLYAGGSVKVDTDDTYQTSGSAITLGGHTMNDIDIGSEFVDTDDHLMTSGAIKEKIESYGYATQTGDITGVTAGTGLSGGGTSGSVTLQLDGTYLKENGSWTGDLVSGHGWSRVFTFDNGGAVMSWITKNNQMSTLIDGSYFAYEAGSNQGGGFWSSTSSDYDNAPGIVASAAAELKVTTADGGDSNLLVTGTIKATGTNAFTIGNVADVARIQESSGTFTLLTTGNAYANLEVDDLTTAGKIIHEGDTNTHMNFSAADTWKVTCGGHNSLTAIAHRVYVNASGANGLLINNDEGNAADSARIFFEGTSTSVIMQQGNDFSFRTGGTTGSSSGTERFKISSGGNCYATGSLDVTSTITTNYGVAFTNGDTNFLFYNNTGDDLIYLRDTTNSKMIQTWYPNSTSITGGLVVNESGGDYDTRIEGDTDTNLVRVDAGNDRVGIGTGSPSYLLHVDGHAYAASSFLGPDGSAGTPSYRFHNDGNTGMYNVGGSDALGFSVGGNLAYQITANHQHRFYESDATTNYLEIIAYDDYIYFHHSAGNYFGFQTDHGRLDIGAMNDGWAHLQTDRAKFYFNKKVVVDEGIVAAYDEDLSLRRNYANTDDEIIIEASEIKFRTDAVERLKMGSAGITISRNAHPDGDANMAINLGGSYGGGLKFNDTAHSGIWVKGNGTEMHFGVGGGSYASPGSEQGLFMMEDNGNFHADADVIAFSTSVGSDIKLKENVENINYGLNDILKMRAVQFDWKEKRNKAHDIGVIAQEIEKIIPEVVKEAKTIGGSDDTHKVVDYAKLTSVLIKAVQEQQVQIDELKTKLGD